MQAVIQNVKKNDEGEILMNKIMDTKNKRCRLGEGNIKKINKKSYKKSEF